MTVFAMIPLRHGLFVALLTASLGGQAMQAAQAQDSGDGVLNPLAAVDPASLKGFTERPLFSPSRRAAAQPEPIETTAAIVPESVNLRLLGVIVTPQGAVAHVEDLDDGSKQALRQGDSFRDWTVISIDASNLTLGRGDESLSFTVFAKPAVPSVSEVTGGEGASSEENGNADADAARPPRAVRVIEETGPSGGQGDAGRVGAKPQHSAQDRIDFFGTDATPPTE